MNKLIIMSLFLIIVHVNSRKWVDDESAHYFGEPDRLREVKSSLDKFSQAQYLSLASKNSKSSHQNTLDTVETKPDESSPLPWGKIF